MNQFFRNDKRNNRNQPEHDSYHCKHQRLQIIHNKRIFYGLVGLPCRKKYFNRVSDRIYGSLRGTKLALHGNTFTCLRISKCKARMFNHALSLLNLAYFGDNSGRFFSRELSLDALCPKETSYTKPNDRGYSKKPPTCLRRNVEPIFHSITQCDKFLCLLSMYFICAFCLWHVRNQTYR